MFIAPKLPKSTVSSVGAQCCVVSHALLTERGGHKEVCSINIGPLTGRRQNRRVLIDKLKNVFLFKRDVVLLQPGQILFLKRPATVMFFLVLNISDDCIQL